MLLDVCLKEYPFQSIKIERGIYESFHFNFELEFRGYQDYELDFPRFESDPGFSSYGVCDNLEQLKSRLPKEVIESQTHYVISIVNIKKSQQPSTGGWRWHKWGPYIGNQNPLCEYLYDEPNIEEVFTYSILRVGPVRCSYCFSGCAVCGGSGKAEGI